jgi:hypothetical protein
LCRNGSRELFSRKHSAVWKNQVRFILRNEAMAGAVCYYRDSDAKGTSAQLDWLTSLITKGSGTKNAAL